MPLETPSDGLDLLAMQEAGRAVEEAAARIRAEAIRERLAPSLAGLAMPIRQAMEALVHEMARIGVEAEAARQTAVAMQRERGEWLQIDPLRHIPEDRGVPPPPPPARIELHAADPDFVGFGWHAAERRDSESWRWSGAAQAASVVIPDLGPGTIALELQLELPFRQPFEPGALTILANGEPLEIEVALAEPHRGTFSAQWEGAEAPGANLGLVLLGPLVSDPSGRDTRKLGVGLWRVRAWRLSADPG